MFVLAYPAAASALEDEKGLLGQFPLLLFRAVVEGMKAPAAPVFSIIDRRALDYTAYLDSIVVQRTEE